MNKENLVQIYTIYKRLLHCSSSYPYFDGTTKEEFFILLLKKGIKDFRNADFRNADFRNADFRNADFRNVDFRNADFENADFKNIDFRNANFKNANFENANFENANFENANFENANSRNTDFRNANFRNADFRNVNFRNADFRNADFENANLISFEEYVFSFNYQDKKDINTFKIKIGCQNKNIREWLNIKKSPEKIKDERGLNSKQFKILEARFDYELQYILISFGLDLNDLK